MLKRLLADINRLGDIIECSLERGEFSQIDKDLVKERLRGLYEDALFIDCYSPDSSNTIYFDEEANEEVMDAIASFDSEDGQVSVDIIEQEQEDEQEIEPQSLVDMPKEREIKVTKVPEVVIFESPLQDSIIDFMTIQQRDTILSSLFLGNQASFDRVIEELDLADDFDSAIIILNDSDINLQSEDMAILVDALEKRFI